MDELGIVVIQMEEAKRFLKRGRPEYHRLALILLDNVAELQMLRAAKSEISTDELYEKMRKSLEHESLEKLPPSLQEIARRESFTPGKKKKIEKYFGEKVKYLSGEKKKIKPAVAEFLNYLHDYRNEVYHAGTLPPGLVQALAILLFDLNCDLFEMLPLATYTLRSEGDYSWMKSYGVNSGLAFAKEVIPKVSGKLRLGIRGKIAKRIVPELVKELDRQFEAFDKNLDSISQGGDMDEAFRAAQYFGSSDEASTRESPPAYKDFVPEHKLADIARQRSVARKVNRTSDPRESFRRFARVTRTIKKTMMSVNRFAEDLDEYIQSQVDIARGK